MAWIESHIKTRRHHKFLRLALELNIKPVYLVGHLHNLWWNILELREDGDVTVWTPKEIAHYAEYEGNAEQFYKELLDKKWLINQNGSILVNDWLDYAGRYLQAKYRSRPEEWHKIQAKYTNSHPVQSSCAGVLPNQSNQSNQSNQVICVAFEQLWSKYPSKVGKKQAEKHFNSSVRSDVDVKLIATALENYLKSDRVAKGYVQNASTWFCNWRDWITPPEAQKPKLTEAQAYSVGKLKKFMEKSDG